MVKPVVWDNVPNLTLGLRNFGNQFNRRWPNRSGASDGAHGDYIHSLETSGHNPDDTPGSKPEWEDADKVPEYRAIDVDSDLGEPGTNMQMVIDHLRRLPHINSVIRYMIYDRKMYHVNNNWYTPVPYTGASAHTEHAHFSGAWNEASDQNSTFDFLFEKVGNPVANVPIITKGDTGETVVYWQYMHNMIRGMFTPNLPTLKIDGDYGPAMADAFAKFYLALNPTAKFTGEYLPGWLAVSYQNKLSQRNAPEPAPVVDPLIVKTLINEWLAANVSTNMSINGSFEGRITLP